VGYRGIYVSSNPSWYAGYLVSRGGSGGAGLYVDGALWVTGAKTGYVVDLAVNDGTEALETGDVVVISGYAPAVSGQIPVIRVRKATAADSTSVAGVVDQPIEMRGPADGHEAPLPSPAADKATLVDGTAVQPGGRHRCLGSPPDQGRRERARSTSAICWCPRPIRATASSIAPGQRDRQGAERIARRHGDPCSCVAEIGGRDELEAEHAPQRAGSWRCSRVVGRRAGRGVHRQRPRRQGGP
jgi:hypothetical protein